MKKIKSVDKVRIEQRKQTLEGDPKSYATLLLGGEDGGGVLDKAAKRTDIIQYILVLANDLITGELRVKPPAEQQLLTSIDAPPLCSAIIEQPEPYKPFLHLLNRDSNPEDPVPLLASSFLANLVASSLTKSQKPTSRDIEALPKLFTYQSSLVKSQDSGLQDIGVQQFSTLLRTKRAKKLFWKQKKDTVDPLMDILRTAAGAGKDSDSTLWNGATSIRSSDTKFGGGVSLQLLYHVLLVIWQLSFEGKIVGEGLEKDHEIVPLYTQLLRMSPKEKTTRLLLATMNNLIADNKDLLIPIATTARLPALIGNLGGRHLTDSDLLEDLQHIDDMLSDFTKDQTTFDEYAAEVQSGHLRWTPPHKNPTFWRDNARRILEENKGELPKKLAEIMAKSWDTDKKVLAIACNDVGNLVKEVPEKRGQLEKLGLKARTMELMTSSDEAVRWESLKAVGEWLRYNTEK